MKLSSKCLQIGGCHMQNEWMTLNNRKTPGYHVDAAMGRLQADKNSLTENTWPNLVKNEQHIGLKKPTIPPSPKKQNKNKTKQKNDARDRKPKCYWYTNTSIFLHH